MPAVNACSQLFKVYVRLNISPADDPGLEDLTRELVAVFRRRYNIRLYLAEVCSDWRPGGESACVSATGFESRLNRFEEYLQANAPELFTRRARLSFCGSSCGLIRKQNAVIGPCGELYRCEHMIGRSSEVIGSCAEGLYYNDADAKFSHIPHPAKCRSCIAFPLCMSGCPNDILEQKNDRIDCSSHREHLLQAMLRHASEASALSG